MDLIYANEQKKELGIINDYELDLAFGMSENDFELTLPLEKHCLNNGYLVFFENTEIGGIVDEIAPNTENDTVVYKGRTWQGILNSKILEPETNQDYLIVGATDDEVGVNANEVIQYILELIGLSDFFKTNDIPSTILINSYQFERYIPAYEGILKMLLEYEAKLEFEKKGSYVILNVVPSEDYTDNEEWTNDLYTFQISRNYRPVNHLICLGKGDLQQRKVIHLFTDENGGVQPYANIETPYKDSDYILDKRNQVLFGVDEVCEVYDNNGANETENYVILKEQPDDWKKRYTDYFYYEIKELEDNEELSEDEYAGEFKNIEEVVDYSYTIQTTKPTNWNTNYSDYFYLDNTEIGREYKTVEPIETPIYSKVSKKPWNWKTAYQNYYTRYDDGDGHIEYNAISGTEVKTYKKQTHRPSDFLNNWKNYFGKKKYYKYKYIEKERKNTKSVWKSKVVWKDSKVNDINATNHKLKYQDIKKLSKIGYVGLGEIYKNRPKWKKNKFYTEHISYKAPKFVKNRYFWQSDVKITIPTWKSNTYYTQSEIIKSIPFIKNFYYKKYIDNYADLVNNGLKKLKDSYDCDEIKIQLISDNSYDINDIVGAKEDITGIEVFQPITKKIIKVEKNIITIDYEIGSDKK